MTKLLQIGHSTRQQIGARRYGHIACTLGGVNYESTARTKKNNGSGCVRGSSARGATDPMFRNKFFILLQDAAAKEAKEYADSCVGQPYRIARVPSKNHGGDCSGFVSGIICVAKGKPIKRLFTTAEWLKRFDDSDLKFAKGLGGGAMPGRSMTEIGVVDRPYPGFVVRKGRFDSGHVKWVQARLNFALHGDLLVDGDFGNETEKVVKAFQSKHDLLRDGEVGKKTWRMLNNVN
jgi:peptidoglycan hydrolase-like protein with peptidoglycan-binding domain